jgi:hypothetical protein
MNTINKNTEIMNAAIINTAIQNIQNDYMQNLAEFTSVFSNPMDDENTILERAKQSDNKVNKLTINSIHLIKDSLKKGDLMTLSNYVGWCYDPTISEAGLENAVTSKRVINKFNL